MRLEWRNLGKRLGGRTILANLNGAVEAGEVLVVTGANGSGKTTLLRLLAGLSHPTAGLVTLANGGQRPQPMSACLREVGFVTPELALYGELTAIENLDFFARARGLRPNRSECRRQLERFGLGDRGDDELRAFSSGMKQRLKLAFATLHQPHVLLLDEPGSNLDDAGDDVVRQLVQQQRGRGLCVLATNDERERSIGDRIFTLGRDA